MLTREEQQSVLCVTENYARACVESFKKERDMKTNGLTYHQTQEHKLRLRRQLVDLLKEIG